jgi:hypothetical protein
MKYDLLTILATYSFYFIFKHEPYQASWKVHTFAILVPILILHFLKDLDLSARLFIIAILTWHIIDVLKYTIEQYQN